MVTVMYFFWSWSPSGVSPMTWYHRPMVVQGGR